MNSPMQARRVVLIAFTTFLATISTGGIHKLPIGLGSPTLQTVAQTQDVRKTQANQLLQQGIEAYQSSQVKTAVQSWQQALILYRELHDREGEGAALGNLGVAYHILGDYSKAIEYHQQHLTIAREIGDRQGEADSLGNLGIAYKALGNYVKTIDYQQQTLEIQQAIKDRQGQGRTLSNLGNAYAELGDYDKAIEYNEKSLIIARYLGNRQGEGIALVSLGATYAELGNYDKAIEYNEESLTLAHEFGDRQTKAIILNNLGVAYHAIGNLTRAIEYYQQSAGIAQQISNRQVEGDALGGLGLAYENLGNYAKAIEYHEQSLAIARKNGDLRDEALALNNLGHTLLVSGNLVEAERKLRISVDVLDSLRSGLDDTYKGSIFDTQVLTYNLLQQVLVAQNKPEAALEMSERGRSRAFVDLLLERLSSSDTQGIDAIRQISAKPLTIEQIRQIAQEQNATLVEYSIIPDEFIAQGKLRGKDLELLIWVIQPTGGVAFRRVNLKPPLQQQNIALADLVASSRESIGVRGRGSIKVEPLEGASQTKRLHQLHQLLIQPITDLLPKDPNSRVIFLPHESLFLVPFAALQDTSGKYLIEQHTILTAPAIQVLELTHQQRAKVQKADLQDVLVLGNPTMPSVSPKLGEPPQQLPSLPGAEEEAKAIAALLNTKALIGNQATKAAFLQQVTKARLIHLATHGLLDDLDDLKGLKVPGAIALAPSGKDKGLLTADEILELKLNVELVVLSACDTGRGRITGDGVMGLSRSLITAGAPSVIVSLWSVPDAPTASLMTNFYHNFQEQKLDKAQSLRKAMLATMKQHSNPRDWAAFTLIGEAE